MIPLILTILITLTIGLFDMEPWVKPLVLLIVFMYSLYGINHLVYSLIQKEEKKLNIGYVPVSKINISDHYVMIDSVKYDIKNIRIQQHRRLLKNAIIRVPLSRKKAPNNIANILTLPNVWFNKCNKWTYKPHLGKVVIVINKKYNEKKK